MKCPQCSGQLSRVASGHGERFHCATCDRSFKATTPKQPESPQIPSSKAETAPHATASPSRETSSQPFIKAGPVIVPPISFRYRMGIVGSAVVSIVLCILYLCILLGLARLLYSFATNSVYATAAKMMSWYALYGFGLFLYAIPLAAGAFVIACAAVPLLGLRRTGTVVEGLSRNEEPRIYEFADSIADAVSAPKPDVIRIEFDANASAAFIKGKFVLSIGCLLIDGLSAEQLAGVLAHEFGHFTQAGGGKVRRLSTRINNWIEAGAHGHPRLTSWSEQLSVHPNGAVKAIGFLGGLGALFTQGIFWCLSMLGRAATSALSRELEYHADTFEYGLTGAECFAATSRRMLEISAANGLALDHLRQSVDERHLPNDIFGFATLVADRLPTASKKAAIAFYKDIAISPLATHPPIGLRVARAKESAARGSLSTNIKPTSLLTNYREKKQLLTLLLYKGRFRRPVDPARLVAAEVAIEGMMRR